MFIENRIKKILIPLPNKVYKGGICSYWSAMFESFKKFSDIEFKVIKIGNRGKNIFGPPLDQWRFHRAITEDIDLAILNPSVLNRAFFREGLLAKQLISKEVPFIVFFHGWDIEFEKRVDNYYREFFLNSFGHAKKIITLSPEARDTIIEWGYRDEVIVETTVVDSSLLKDFSLEKKRKSRKIKILFLARMEVEKGVFELIEAFQILYKEFNNLELILAGNGTAYERVKEYVQDIEAIKMVGHIEGEEKANLFRESDIYSLPSYSEGLPVSILEAMAFGLPIVTTSVGGLKHFFKENKMGYTTTPKDSRDLTEVLRLLILDKSKMVEMGRFNFDYAQKYLMSDTLSKRLYQHIIKEEHIKRRAV